MNDEAPGEMPHGGVADAGAVLRVGGHVDRPSNPHSATIHRFLHHVRSAGFGGASEPVSIDGERERVVFVPGDVPVPPYPAWSQSDTALASIAQLLRELHDASDGFDAADGTWSSELHDERPGARTVICHNDVCPENVVFRDGRAVTLLDFDYAAPGRREYDIATFARM